MHAPYLPLCVPSPHSGSFKYINKYWTYNGFRNKQFLRNNLWLLWQPRNSSFFFSIPFIPFWRTMWGMCFGLPYNQLLCVLILGRWKRWAKRVIWKNIVFYASLKLLCLWLFLKRICLWQTTTQFIRIWTVFCVFICV